MLSKILGLFYKLPLAKVLGSSGLGIYQSVFPIYALFVCIGSGAIVLTLSKVVSATAYSQNAMKKAFIYCTLFSVTAGSFLYLLSGSLANYQGVPHARYVYKCLSPAIVFCCLGGCIKGYYQGHSDMLPTAVAEIIVQCIKPCFGLALCRLFTSVQTKTAAATFAITLGELVAFLFLLARYITDKKSPKLLAMPYNIKDNLFALYTPILLSNVILPLSLVYDSFTVINALAVYSEHALGLYGLFAGAVITLQTIPATISYGLSNAIIPYLSSLYAKGNKNGAEKGVYLATTLTAFLALPLAGCLYAYAPIVASTPFFRGGMQDISLITKLIRVATPYAIFLPLLQTCNSILYGKGKVVVPVVSLLFSVIFKIILQTILLKNAKIGIFGYALSLNLCYILAVTIDLVYIIRDGKITVFLLKTIFATALSVFSGWLVYQKTNFILGIALTALCYMATQTVLRCYKLDSQNEPSHQNIKGSNVFEGYTTKNRGRNAK